MQWLELSIQTASAGVETVAERLTVLGYDSFINDDQAEFEDFLEQNRQYWDYVDEDLAQKMQGLSQIRLYIEDGPTAPETLRQLEAELALLKRQHPGADLGTLEIRLRNLQEEDWENNWKQYYQPLPIGQKLIVVPQWLDPHQDPARIPVRLDPGMIFGTGAHASTQMCLVALEEAVRGGERVIDLGSGSGILSIAALLLGAATATGVDIDPKAEDIARENAAFNDLHGDRFTAVTGDVIGDVSARRGNVLGMLPRGNAQQIDANIPLSNMFGYATDLRSRTQGRGQYSMEPSHYIELPKSLQEELIAKRTKG